MESFKQKTADDIKALVVLAFLALLTLMYLLAKQPAYAANSYTWSGLIVKFPDQAKLLADASTTEVFPFFSGLRVAKAKVKTYPCYDYLHNVWAGKKVQIISTSSRYQTDLLFTNHLYLFHCILLI